MGTVTTKETKLSFVFVGTDCTQRNLKAKGETGYTMTLKMRGLSLKTR